MSEKHWIEAIVLRCITYKEIKNLYSNKFMIKCLSELLKKAWGEVVIASDVAPGIHSDWENFLRSTDVFLITNPPKKEEHK